MNNNLEINVRGAHPITFKNGCRTGDMTEFGVGVDTVFWADERRNYGGCINREEATQIRDFLNECIDGWEKENDS